MSIQEFIIRLITEKTGFIAQFLDLFLSVLFHTCNYNSRYTSIPGFFYQYYFGVRLYCYGLFTRERYSCVPARDDTGRLVIVNSVGGPSWPDNRSGREVLDHYDSVVAKHTKTDQRKRALENVKGTIIWRPYKLQYVANGKTKGKDGNYLKRKEQFVLTKQKFITEPYWNVLLDGYNREILFCEKELTFE